MRHRRQMRIVSGGPGRVVALSPVRPSRVLRGAALVLIAAVVSLACSTAQHPKTDVLCWSKDLAFGADAWRAEVESRFGPGALVIVCHGQDEGGRWVFRPDGSIPVADLVAQLAARRDRPVVLVTCNPGGYALTGVGGNVYYARRDVLVPPYTNSPLLRLRWAGRCEGSIWSFHRSVP